MSELWPTLGYALALLAAGLALVWLEVLVVSFGLIGAVATACLAGSVYLAFQVGPSLGWSFALLAPSLAVVILVAGVRRMARSRLVMRGEVGGDAGYRHETAMLGVKVGARGIMVTPAHPSGRARFDGGECDVRAQSGSLSNGQSVRVLRIEGATVEVVAVPADAGHDVPFDNTAE